jgi:hypothetical protein
MRSIVVQARERRLEGEAGLRNDVEPASKPSGHTNFVEFARRHRQHRGYGVVSRNLETVPVQHHEHDEAGPGESLVAVNQWMVSGDPHSEDGGLVDELRVEVLASKRLRLLQQRAPQPSSGTSLCQSVKDLLIALSDLTELAHELLVMSNPLDFGGQRVHDECVDADTSTSSDDLHRGGQLLRHPDSGGLLRHAIMLSSNHFGRNRGPKKCSPACYWICY